MNEPKKKKQKTNCVWEDVEDFSTREVRNYSHHKKYMRKCEDGPDETEIHLSVLWLKKAVEEFHKPGTQIFKDHCMDLKCTANKLNGEICGALGRHDPFGVNYINVVLNQSKVTEETTTLRLKTELDEVSSKEAIRDKCRATGKCDCHRPQACVSHEDKDREAARAEAKIRSSRDQTAVEKKQTAHRFRTKRTSAKRRLSAVQKFVEKKGDLVSDEAITFV